MSEENSNNNGLCRCDGKEVNDCVNTLRIQHNFNIFGVCVSVPNMPACCGMQVVPCLDRVVNTGCECCKCSKRSLDFINRICQATVKELAKKQVPKERYSVFDGGPSLDNTPGPDGRRDLAYKKQKYRSDSSSDDGKGKDSPRRKSGGKIRKRQTSKDSKKPEELRRQRERKGSEVLERGKEKRDKHISGYESDDEYEPAPKTRKGEKGTKTPPRNLPDRPRHKPSDGKKGKPRKSEEFVQKKVKGKGVYESDDEYGAAHKTGKGKKGTKITPNDSIEKPRGKASDSKKAKPKKSEDVDEKKIKRKGNVLKSSGSEVSESIRKIPRKDKEGSKGNGKMKIDADEENAAKKVKKGKAIVYDSDEEGLLKRSKKEETDTEKGSKSSKKGKEIIDEKSGKKSKFKFSFDRIMPEKKLKDSTIGKIEKNGNKNASQEKSETYEIFLENKSTEKRAKIDKKAIDDFSKEKFGKKPEKKLFKGDGIAKKGKEAAVSKISIEEIPKKGERKKDPMGPKISIEQIPKRGGKRKSPDQNLDERSGSKFSKRGKSITPIRSNESGPENERTQRNKVGTNTGSKSKSDKIFGGIAKKKIIGKSNENIGRGSKKSQRKVGDDRVSIYSSRIQKRLTRSRELNPERISHRRSRRLKYWTLPTRFDNIHISDFMRMRLEVSDLRRTGDTEEICRESQKRCIPLCVSKTICTPCNDCGPSCPQKDDCLCCYCL